ncbi:hypothetical protein L208DRAFT_1416403 [Tricholoma matsutake]|nr:hypothetical protein L208DRAFT_1416403 [Tricholoma matsutake 945]
MVVGSEHFDELLRELNRAQLLAGKLAGEIYIAEDLNGHIIGGIIWFGPGREIYDSEDQRHLALAPLIEKMPKVTREWHGSVSKVMADFKKSAFGDAARTQWYLQRVGVLLEWQGKGVGTALIEEVRKKNVGPGMSVVLQAVEPHNFAYYMHLGFVQQGSIELRAPYGEFTIKGFMWKA